MRTLIHRWEGLYLISYRDDEGGSPGWSVDTVPIVLVASASRARVGGRRERARARSFLLRAFPVRPSGRADEAQGPDDRKALFGRC